MASNEDADLILSDAEERMNKSLDDLYNAMSQIRSGRASTALVDDIKVEVYGQAMPLNQVATVSVPEGRTIAIDVWDKSNLQEVEKAIQKSGRNLNPQNDGSMIRINLPEMTEETRKEMTKLAKQKVEERKVSIRNIRRDANDEIKKLKGEGFSEDQVHDYQDQVQKLTDKMTTKMDDVYTNKEKEIMTV